MTACQRPLVGPCAECTTPMHTTRSYDNTPCADGHARHGGRGLCHRCYPAARNAGRLDQYPPTRTPAGPTPPATGQCGTCGRAVVLRADGQPGRHWSTDRKGERSRCPAGELGRPPTRPGRRVQVGIDVVIPADMSDREYRTLAAALLREHAASLLVVDVDVTDGGAS